MTPANGPILCAPLLRKVDAKLLDLLAEMRAEEWTLPTIVPGWSVREVVAHLLDTVLRKLSLVRDQCVVETPEIHCPQDVATFVNRLNREGVAVYRRLSPPLLRSLMESACEESADFHESLDPFVPAAFPVSWAGDTSSPNWFDTAREWTERWHHQQQIREATGRPGIMTPELYHPVLDCFARGLPFAYRDVPGEPGATVRLEIPGDCGGSWQLRKENAGWTLTPPVDPVDARIVIPPQIAWRVFTKGIPRSSALDLVGIEGNRDLALPVLSLTAIVA